MRGGFLLFIIGVIVIFFIKFNKKKKKADTVKLENVKNTSELTCYSQDHAKSIYKEIKTIT